MHLAASSPFRRHKKPTDQSWLPVATLPPRQRTGELCSPAAIPMGKNPSALSLSDLLRVTSPEMERSVTALPRYPPGSRRLLLGPHSPTTAFEAPGRLSQAPRVPPPAAAVVPGLAAVVNQSFTLLGRVTGRVHVVCLGLPPEHSFRQQIAADFSGAKQEAPGYPSM